MTKSTGSTRREFLKRAAAASTAFAAPTLHSGHVLGRDNAPTANEQIIIGVIGVGGRCNQLIDQVPAGGRIVAACRLLPARATDAAKKRNAKWSCLPGLSRDVRQREARRGHHRHARSCPHAALHPCRAGRARCVRRKAAHRVHPRRPRAGRRRAQAQARVPGRHAAAHDGDQPLLLRVHPRRQDRQSETSLGRQLPRPATLRRPCPKNPSRRPTIGTPGAAPPSCGRSTTSCNSPGCNGATTPAAR